MEFYASGNMVFGLAVVIVNFKVAIMQYDYTWASTILFVLMLSLYFISIMILNFVYLTTSFKTFVPMLITAFFHLGNIVCLTITSLMDYGLECYNRYNTSFKHSLELKEYTKKLLDGELDESVVKFKKVNQQ